MGDGQGGGYASPVAADGLVYLARNKFGVSASDAKTGEDVYTARIKADRDNFLSPAPDGGYLFAPNQDWRVGVVRAGREFELVGVNDLCGDGERLVGSLFFAGGRLYLRTHKFLFALGPP